MPREPFDDWMVTVCDACLTACCWHGELYCERYKTAGVTTRLASELRAMNRENPESYSREKIREVTGETPPLVTALYP